MNIISHRGYWKSIDEKNTREAFVRSFSMGFGTETDIRDLNGKLVVSHDVPSKEVMFFDDFCELYSLINPTLLIALNIKSDGLQELISEKLKQYQVKNYFLFDMSTPDLIQTRNKKLNFYTRQSELEVSPILYHEANGIWMDEFTIEWIKEEIIEEHINNGKKVCIVSSELHQRDYFSQWAICKKIDQRIKSDDLILCTDFPEKAKEFMND